MLRVILAVGLAAALSAPAIAQDANAVIADALKAMGDLRTVEFSATGYDFVLGQNFNGASPWPKWLYCQLWSNETCPVSVSSSLPR